MASRILLLLISTYLATPIPPTQDPFYSPTEGFETSSPGTVLRIREAVGNLTTLAGSNCSAAYNIVYRTTNSRYNADYAVTTIFVPASPSPALLSYQVPYDSAYLDASPSYALYSTDGASWMQDVSTALSLGWFVSVPDYEGPLASFTAGVQSGHATLDSVRAILNANASNGLGLLPDTRSAMWGYSGGALASEWAAELQVQYAPELNFSGAALGGLTPNVSSVLDSINGQIDAGLGPSSFLGLSSQYPELRQFLVSKLKTTGPYNATGFLAAENYTNSQAVEAFAFQNITDYFVGGISDLLGPLALSVANVEGQMGYHGVPQMPIFAYKAIADEVSIVNDTDVLMERYCNVGANILYNRNTIGGHAAEEINGRPAALSFLQSVLSDMNATGFPSSGCKTQDVSVNITDTVF
ncbi:hypothetical protein M406DRAFT_61238 [Cryphonectria parasitica EP155]|uniref:Lipase 1 n=1 Tax=Cryphonectria parasitica (strain ATCC 38755 / EP155) TaxID=660469 RepID=A0A9P4Y5E7_CRYP1|nr:uncharacterized protein M406DRAFT_61238 [Cryphonectria parasitica EP155]KAF3767289.1 hypothetical protein M406DRAFT_61238 [Cryphonectria parasitica EP155]